MRMLRDRISAVLQDRRQHLNPHRMLDVGDLRDKIYDEIRLREDRLKSETDIKFWVNEVLLRDPQFMAPRYWRERPEFLYCEFVNYMSMQILDVLTENF